MKRAAVNMSRLNLDYMVQSEVTLPDGRTRYIAISKFDGAMYDIATSQSHDEARILRALDGKEGITKYYGAWSEPTLEGSPVLIQQETNLLGSLQDVPRLEEADILSLLLDVCSGLKSLHDIGYAHGNVSAANILIFKVPKRCVYKLANFGSCVTLDAHQHNNLTLRNMPHVSTAASNKVSFASPDLLRAIQRNASHHLYLAEADVFAFGLVLLHCLGTLPLAHSLEGKDLAHGIVRPALVRHVGSHLQAVIRKSLEFDPTLRPLPGVILDVLSMSLSIRKNEATPRAMPLLRSRITTPRVATYRGPTHQMQHHHSPQPQGWNNEMRVERSPLPPPLPRRHRPGSAAVTVRPPVVPSQGKYDKAAIKSFIRARHNQLIDMIHCTEYAQYTTQ